MKYVKDEETEKLGGYGFECICGEECIVPKDYPHIKVTDEATVNKVPQ